MAATLFGKPSQIFTRETLKALILIILLQGVILPGLSAAATIPYHDNFEFPDGSAPSSTWAWKDKDGSNGSYHQINDSSLEIVAGGDSQLNEFYTVFLDNISGSFTVVVQLPLAVATDPGTRNGIIIQNNLSHVADNQGHVQIALNPGSGIEIVLDDNGDGTPDGSKTATINFSPPNIWLKLVRNGNTVAGSYSSDGRIWVALDSFTLTKIQPSVDVGLFTIAGNTGSYGTLNTARFDNFSLVDATTTYLHYKDSDSDTYGDRDETILTDSSTPPSGYVANFQDCDDSRASIYPGATEICDGLDNDCDGTIDDGFTTTVYYRDADGDGYGTQLDTAAGCSAPTGYITTGGDCDDTDANINPAAADICNDGIDQNCAAGDANCGSTDTNCDAIAEQPLSVAINNAPPLIMFVLDDSGSMSNTVLCPEVEGNFNGFKVYDQATADAWRSQWFGYNGLYYNPADSYTHWPNYSNATFTDALLVPGSTNPSDKTSLKTTFTTVGSVSITKGHYYMWSSIENAPYCVDLGYRDSGPTYFKVASYEPGTHGDVLAIGEDTSPPADVVMPQATLAEARQNFANWFTYYRSREYAAKSAVAQALMRISNAYVGIYTLNESVVQGVLPVGVPGKAENTNFLLTKLFAVAANGGTPLRRALRNVGQYYHADDGKTGNIGTSPYFTQADGGDCQRAFAIVMTDGYSNGGTPSPWANHADTDEDTIYDGYPYGSTRANRLSDYAMVYYENDINSSLPNNLIPTAQNPAPHQHMVTYTISFGLEGNLTPNDTCPQDISTCPTWPTTNTNEDKIDYLWLTAVAGRGRYLFTNNTEALIQGLETIVSDISSRSRTGASISASSQRLESGLNIFQGFFNSADWSGDVKAFSVDDQGVVNQTPLWSANTELQDQNWDTGRTILFHDNGTTKAFRHDNLPAAIKAIMNGDQIKYVRGDQSKEESNGGAFRTRTSLIGDVIHSSPIFENDVIYYGSNDGMLHAVDADDGEEIFAFIPSFVMPNLNSFTGPSYSHKYFVDGTPAIGRSGTSSWLIGGLNRGGRGFYGINITNTATISETSRPATWEYPATGASDNDLGYTFGDISIVPTEASAVSEPLVFAGNGYDSSTGKAVLYIFRLNGTLLKKINTNAGGTTPGTCNGLSAPLVVDADGNGKADFVYAGDLLGNLWKFDISATDYNNWDVDYRSGTVNKPVMTAKSISGNIQPITSRPAAMLHCNPERRGVIVFFATGRLLSSTDAADTTGQSIYAIWDWKEDVEVNGAITPGDGYFFGDFNAPSGSPPIRDFSNLSGNGAFPPGQTITLLQQALVSTDGNFRETTNREINWFSNKAWKDDKAAVSTYTGGLHVGWYMNLPESGERVVSRLQIRDGKVYVVSTIPSSEHCAAGSDAVITILDACNGGQLDEAQFDEDMDGDVDSSDRRRSGKKFSQTGLFSPAIIEDKLFFTKDNVETTREEKKGIIYWRIRE